MFQIKNQPTKTPTKTKAQPTKALTQQEAYNELYKKPFSDSPFWILLPHLYPVWLVGIGIIFFYTALKRGWLHRFFDFVARIFSK
jgi:hypothetical protein